MTGIGQQAGGRRSWLVLLVVTSAVLAGAGFYTTKAYLGFQESRAAAPGIELAQGAALPARSFVLFRNTAAGQGYGMAATVPLAAPAGPRTVSATACDRVYATGGRLICLSTTRGLVTSFEASVYGPDWERLEGWALPGIPSRTRFSGDGAVVATTVFVTGHSYAGSGFSTETTIRSMEGGKLWENLEEFALLVNGGQVTAADRNIWGVTFVPGQPDVFYATTAATGRHWLVRGSLSARTLTAIHDGAECPSISPDGTRIAYKKNVGAGLTPHWSIAVLDLARGQVTVLRENRNVDDQVEWLDDETLLYGLPREGSAGDSDVWRIPAEAGEEPQLYIEHAWSPSVVR